MSRYKYSDDCDGWALIRWRGAVYSAIRGQRGQAFLRGMLTALDAMPQKRLIANRLEQAGEHCALGVVGAARGVRIGSLDVDDDEYDRKAIGELLNVAPALVAEVMFENDEGGWLNETPEMRWERMRDWVVLQIVEGGT